MKHFKRLILGSIPTFVLWFLAFHTPIANLSLTQFLPILALHLLIQTYFSGAGMDSILQIFKERK